MLTNNILAVIQYFSDHGIQIGKTILQKIVYLSFDEENKRKFYRPYFYGPYSEVIQLMVNSLVGNDLVNYRDDRRLELVGSTSYSFMEPFKERFINTVGFLFKNDIKSTKEISNLAKVNMIVANNNGNSKNPNFIIERAGFLGWSELSSLSVNEIKSLIILNDELESLLAPNS